MDKAQLAPICRLLAEGIGWPEIWDERSGEDPDSVSGCLLSVCTDIHVWETVIETFFIAPDSAEKKVTEQAVTRSCCRVTAMMGLGMLLREIAKPALLKHSING